MHGQEPIVGKGVKVWLTGETPWAEVIFKLPDGRWIGRIDNDLQRTDLHGYAYNDLVVFELLVDAGHANLWVPATSQYREHYREAV